MPKKARKNALGPAITARRASEKAKSKSNGGKVKATSRKEADYEALIFYQCKKRKGEIQRLGFKADKKFNEAYKKAKALVKLLVSSGGYSSGDILLMGIVRTVYYDRWYDIHMRKRAAAKKAIKKYVEDVKSKPSGKAVKTIKPISWVNPMSTDIFKTRG